jgi:hypothetical protein
MAFCEFLKHGFDMDIIFSGCEGLLATQKENQL